ncbi:hypothetical protein LOAG_02224 [Loa loa]|uniref:Uncharacterized protein n=1 Tax=Loa loa TaxID=7209 RepID=A0A1S0U907_LOALO|nr:hypothetical protein LOAG_02224 [Loa loa]EFO26255.1 hypothetical protein LOAG_02224 [Loa loa]
MTLKTKVRETGSENFTPTLKNHGMANKKRVPKGIISSSENSVGRKVFMAHLFPCMKKFFPIFDIKYLITKREEMKTNGTSNGKKCDIYRFKTTAITNLHHALGKLACDVSQLSSADVEVIVNIQFKQNTTYVRFSKYHHNEFGKEKVTMSKQ